MAVNPKPDAATVIAALPGWFDHNNALHPLERWATVPARVHRITSKRNHGGDRARKLRGYSKRTTETRRHCPFIVGTR